MEPKDEVVEGAHISEEERAHAHAEVARIAALPDVVLISPEGKRCTAKPDDAADMVKHCNYVYESSAPVVLAEVPQPGFVDTAKE